MNVSSVFGSFPETTKATLKPALRELLRINEPDHQVRSKIFSKMNDFRKENQFCDVVLSLGSTEFPCHSVIVAAASTYIHDALITAWESDEPQNIILENLSIEALENTLEYIYRQDTNVTINNVYELFKASQKLGVADLEEYCVLFMESNLPLDNIFEIFSYADLKKRDNLFINCCDLILENFSVFKKNPLFYKMPDHIIHHIISTVGEKMKSHDEILDIIVEWNRNARGSEEQTKHLISCINSGNVSNDYLSKLICKDNRSRLHTRVVKDLDKNYPSEDIIYDDCNDKWTSNAVLSHRNHEKNVGIDHCLFTLMVLKPDEPTDYTNVFEMKDYNDDDGSPQILTNPPIVITKYAMVAVYHTLYLYNLNSTTEQDIVINSFTRCKITEKSKQLFTYVCDIDEWFSVPKPDGEPTKGCLVSANNALYLIGGEYDEAKSKCNAQFYDSRKPSWTSLPSSSFSHIDGAACSYDGNVYVLGGTENSSQVLEVFDVKAGKWQTLKSTSRKYQSHNFLHYGDNLWAIGRGKNPPIECYHSIVNLWNEPMESLTPYDDVYFVDSFVF